MRQIIFLTLLLVFISLNASAETLTRTVNNLSDAAEEGTLRVVLQAACNDAGDDEIWFRETLLDSATVQLNSELVIPKDCKGWVSLYGSPSVDTILDASKLDGAGKEAGDACIINVYSDNNLISDFSLVNHERGAGICFFGRNNRIENSRLGATKAGQQKPNRYGVVVSNNFSTEGDDEDMDGSGSQIVANTIEYNYGHGIFIKADDVVVEQNQILSNGGCPDEPLFLTQDECVQSDQEQGFGISVAKGSRNVLVGGEDFTVSANTIQFNKSGGVAVAGPTSPLSFLESMIHPDFSVFHKLTSVLSHSGLGLDPSQVLITHNIISMNYGEGEGIDLAVDGFTENDTGDVDRGPNSLLNYIDHFQTFGLVPSGDGSSRFWAWGIAASGTKVEVYLASNEDLDRERYHGGGDAFVTDLEVEDLTFSINPEEGFFAMGDNVTGLVFNANNATSEFAYSVFVGTDSDHDGLADSVETQSSADSDDALADSDDDFLSDAFEDKNRNGICETELGETCANAADTDGDNLSDYVESHGDGLYDEGTDTNPLNADTDNDGLDDGAEDKNGNGIFEPYLSETSPLNVDSDDDGVDDGADNCPSVYNPGQEASYCQS